MHPIHYGEQVVAAFKRGWQDLVSCRPPSVGVLTPAVERPFKAAMPAFVPAFRKMRAEMLFGTYRTCRSFVVGQAVSPVVPHSTIPLPLNIPAFANRRLGESGQCLIADHAISKYFIC
jgi:hypothetical protein